MANRYYMSPGSNQDHVTLEGDEAHHLLHVVRAVEGDRITLFDGTGIDYEAELIEVTRRRATARILERRACELPVRPQLSLAVALPKGERQRWLVEKLVELGVEALLPLQTRRSVAQPTAKALKRLERYVIEACKQCGRSRLMAIAQPLPLDQLLTCPAADALRLFAHPAHERSVGIGDLPQDAIAARRPIFLAIGPEGGFSDEELAAAEAAGWQPLSLGPTILRVETAAIAAAARLLL